MLDVIFPFAGGLGLFLIGMMLLSEGLVAFAGGSLQKALLAFTGRPIKAFFSGALITALAQSSTATTVTLIGFVSAGLITFTQAIGVVIGASFGNTATGWIVATLGLKVNLGFYTLPLIGIGALMKLLGKGRSSELGRALAGFGMLFLGLNTLQDGMQGLAALFSLAHLPAGGYGAYLLIVLLGLVLTAVLQSSTAAIAMTLTALDARFAGLVQRLVPGRATHPEHHLDASLLGVPAVALETSHRALRDIAHRLIALYRQSVNVSAPATMAGELRNMAEVLNEAYEFIARVQLPIDDEPMNQRRSAQLHAVDHLLRLLGRLQNVPASHAGLQDPGYRAAALQASTLADTAQKGLNKQASSTWLQELEAGSTALAELLHDARRKVLTEPMANSEASPTLQATETFRWFERTSRHIWRASHYLYQSANKENTPTHKTDKPAAGTSLGA